MANKKIWAYAINDSGDYIKGDKHPLKIFYIWESLKLRDEKIHEFNKIKFMSTQKDRNNRSQVIPVQKGFYRYKSKSNNSIDENKNDGDSISHTIAIQVLSEMDRINFKCGGKAYEIEVSEIRQDDLKIQLTNRGKFKYYYPDLICFFKKPEALALKWGGKIAIEVNHTHPCEPEKIQDFKSHCIPIIEVNISSMSIEKKINTPPHTPEDYEKYYDYLVHVFGKQVFGKILSDPVSSEYHFKEEKLWLDKLRLIKDELINKDKVIAESHSREVFKSKEVAELSSLITEQKRLLSNKNESISRIKDCIYSKDKEINELNLIILEYKKTLSEKERIISEAESKKGVFYHISNFFGKKG
ncbi:MULTISPECIES: hypothetical protein [Cobetia]|uniref:Uncharacterized protein n=1 Tax=Cobetia crustatorum TaxID=553385 RepID=A0A558HUG9_9GAMM|nr:MULTISPECIES: hypothetical protein [Cobetia]TVU72754.1 hypothetical protein FQP86_03530 [Cobetia crustatorum]